MNKNYRILLYSIIALSIVIVDIFTKRWALAYCNPEYELNRFLTCEVSINRGISWGMLSFDHPLLFFLISSMIVVIFLWLCHYTYYRFKEHAIILGEVMLIAGTFGNLFDRYYYSGVIDFIFIHYKNIGFPALFNVADIFITLGIGIMLITSYERS